MRSCFLFLSCLSILLGSASGQNLQRMNTWQDSLLQLGKQMFSPELAEAERIESNYKFVRTLVSALQEPNAFYYKFDSLEMISIIDSPHDNFRVFSWNIPLQDGSYLYYGAIQHKEAGGKLKLTPLLDKTFEIVNPEKDITTNEMWYGAQYYEIVALSRNSYALLGWKGHHPEYTHKVIEILQVGKEGAIQLGAPIFSDDPSAVRKIFAYSRTSSMYLHFNSAFQRIEFDHIIPISLEYEGNYKYYGSDLTHNAYVLEDGRLYLKENIDLSNPETGNEDKYIDPLRPNTKLKSGF